MKRKGLFLFLFLVLVFVFCFNQINNADTFSHLKAGQLIWQTGQIPYHDVFSFTAPGAPWIPHEWLAEVVFFGVQQVFGFWGLIAFVAGIAALTFFVLFSIARARGAELFISFLTLFVVGAASFSFWVPRPQIFVFLFSALLLYLLERYRDEPKSSYLWQSLLIILVWANTNASVALGILIIGLFFFGIAARDGRWSPAVTRLGKALLGAILLSFLNPGTYHAFTYGITILPELRTLMVYEWQPILAYWSGWDTRWYVAEIAAAAVFLSWRLGAEREDRDRTWLVLVLGASVMPFLAARYLAYWAIFAAAPLAWTLSHALRNTHIAERFSPKRRRAALVLACGGLLIVRVATLPSQYIDGTALPVAAADFLAQNHARGNLFNVYNQGGYLLWRLSPDVKIAMDGRSEVYLGQPTKDYETILKGGPAADALISQYHIAYFMFPYDPAFLGNEQTLLADLSDHGWQLVWWDDGAVIFARDDAQNQALIRQYALHYVGPFINPTDITGANAKPAAAEIDALMTRAPQSTVVAQYAEDFLASHKLKP